MTDERRRPGHASPGRHNVVTQPRHQEGSSEQDADLLLWLEGDVSRLRSFASIVEAGINDPTWRGEELARCLAEGFRQIGLRLESLLEAGIAPRAVVPVDQGRAA